MTSLQRIQDNVSTMAVNTRAAIQRNTQHAKAWVNQNIAPHSSKIAIATGALAATVISTLVLRNFLTNSNVPQTPPSNPTNSSQNQSIDCGYYFDNRYVLAITEACANYTRPIVDFATNLVNVTTQQVCDLFESPSITLADKPVVVFTNSNLNDTAQVVNNTLSQVINYATLIANSTLNATAEVAAANLSSNDTAKVIKNVSNVSIATNSSSNSSRLWENLIYAKNKTVEVSLQFWNSSKTFANQSVYPRLANYSASVQEYAKTHNITAELAYEKLEALIAVSTSSISSYYITEPTIEALRLFLLTSSKMSEEAEIFNKFVQTLLEISNADYSIQTLEQLKNLNLLFENMKQIPALNNFENLNHLAAIYKSNEKKVFTEIKMNFDKFKNIFNLLKKVADEKLKKELFWHKLDINNSKKDSSSIQMMLQSFQNLLTKYYSEKKAPGTSYTATAVAGVAALVAAVVSARLTSLV